MTVKNDFSVPYRSVFGETPGRKIRFRRKIVLNRYFVLSHRRVSAKPPLAQTRVHRISSRTPLTERFEPPPRPTDGPPAVPKGPRSAGRSGLHRFRLNKVQPTSTLNQNWRELIFANPRADPTLAGRFGRFRPARRAGPLRHRRGLARRADPGLAERSASSGQKRTVSLFTFEDRETAPAFDQELCSNVGRSAQAKGPFKPKNRRNRRFLSMTVCIMFAGIGRAGVPRPAATSTRVLSVTRRSTPCAPSPTTRRERVTSSAAPCSPHAPPSLPAPSSLPSPSARFANAPHPITVWADFRVGSFCIEPDMEMRLATALRGRRPTTPDSRFAPARLVRTHPHPAPSRLAHPPIAHTPAHSPPAHTLAHPNRPRTRPPPIAHPPARSPQSPTPTATRAPARTPPSPTHPHAHRNPHARRTPPRKATVPQKWGAASCTRFHAFAIMGPCRPAPRSA